MSDTEPRCPYCDEPASGKWGVLYGDGTPGDDVPVYEIHCTNKGCCAGCLIQQIVEADCIRHANDLKLVDRKVREALDAALARCAILTDGARYESVCAGFSYSVDIAEAIRSLISPASCRQDVDNSNEKGT